MERARMRPIWIRSPRILLCLVALLASASLGCKKDDDLMKRLNEANEKVVSCKKEVNDLKNEVSSLKRQLAVAMANPGKLQLTDPDVINLIAQIRKESGNEDLLGKGSLDPREASRIVMNGAKAMQQCYERALKKNAALQYQAGVGLSLEITVRGAGTVEMVDIIPSVDREMTSCIKNAAMRWRFPTFAGKPVTIQQRVSLTPKT
jgi:hypothetical protein